MRKAGFFITVLLIINPFLLSRGMDKKTVISGVIYNAKDSITVNEQTVELNPQGQFEYDFELLKPNYIELDFGKKISVYLKPGDKVHLEIDVNKDLGTIRVSGDCREINQFLIMQAVESEKVNRYFNENYQELFVLNEKNFIDKMNVLWQPFHDLYNTFRKEHKDADPHFLKTFDAILLYSWASTMMRYPNWYRSFSGRSDYIPSKQFYSFISRLDLNDPELLVVEEYKEVLGYILSLESDTLLASPEFQTPNYKPFRAKMKVTLNQFTDSDVRSEMLYSFMKGYIGEYNHKDGEDLIRTFMENCTNQDYIRDIEESIKYDESIRDQCDVRVYKRIGDVTLDVFLYHPPDRKKGERRPAIAFFHGGGWECGKPEWGHMQCEHFSKLGMVGASFQYRLSTQHNSNPLEGVTDAKSAIRWLRDHADELGIDPDRIVASGYSAGGHLAACTAMIDEFDEPDEDHAISSAANSCMYWVPALMIFEDGWFKDLLGDKAEIKDVDPFSHIRPGLPPCIIFQGTADNTVPFWTVKKFTEKTKAAGNRCDLHVYEGQAHLGWGENTKDVLTKMDAFLESIGYLNLDK